MLNAHQGVLVAGDIVERNVVVGQQTLEVCRQGGGSGNIGGHDPLGNAGSRCPGCTQAQCGLVFGCNNKVGQIAPLAAGGLNKVIPYAQVRGQLGVDFPIVLEVRGAIVAIVLGIPARGEADIAHIVGQQVGNTQIGQRCFSSTSVEFCGVLAVEVVSAAGILRLREGGADSLKLDAELDRVAAVNLGHIVEYLVNVLTFDRRSVSGRTGIT